MPVAKPKVAAPLTLGFSMNDDTMAGEGGSAEKAEAAEDPKGLPTFVFIACEPWADISTVVAAAKKVAPMIASKKVRTLDGTHI